MRGQLVLQMPLACHARHIGWQYAFEGGNGGRYPFLIFLWTLRLFIVCPTTIRVLIFPNKKLWKCLFSFSFPSPVVPLPLELVKVLRSRPDRSPMARPVIPDRVEAAVPCVLELSYKSTQAWDWPARPRVTSLSETARLWDMGGSHGCRSLIISISSL